MNPGTAPAVRQTRKTLMYPFLTVHTLTALPTHNLNRDENGAPKQVTQGGVTRARLSSQSLKRAARIGFERECEQATESVRTKVSATVIADRVAELRGPMSKGEHSALTKSIVARVNSLTRTSDAESKKDTLVWLSATEIETAARAFAAGNDAAIVNTQNTDSLAIAAFGRMFTADPRLSIPSAVSVGDAVTTHAATIELDWFAAVDDRSEHGGAGQLGFAMSTSGVYYRTFTIDRAQLAQNFQEPLDSAIAEVQLRSLVRHLTLDLPTGRRAGTAAQTLPAFILAEEQTHRVNYDFQEPVTATREGGFLTPSIAALEKKATEARTFDPDLFGSHLLSGTVTGQGIQPFPKYLDFVMEFLRR